MSLWADICSIQEIRGPKPKTAPVKLAEDTILAALFTAPPEPRERAKRNPSSRTTDGEDDRARNKERADLEAARRASLIDKETRQIRA